MLAILGLAAAIAVGATLIGVALSAPTSPRVRNDLIPR